MMFAASLFKIRNEGRDLGHCVILPEIFKIRLKGTVHQICADNKGKSSIKGHLLFALKLSHWQTRDHRAGVGIGPDI